MDRVALLAALAVLSGCAHSQQENPDPELWGRVDCQRFADNPALEVEFDLAKTVCGHRAEAAALAGTSGMPMGHGIAGAIAAGIAQGITAAQIKTATVQSCMAERGYLLKRRSEHLAICARIAPPPPPPPPPITKAKPKPKKKSPPPVT
jgi:hypothetical protein